MLTNIATNLSNAAVGLILASAILIFLYLWYKTKLLPALGMTFAIIYGLGLIAGGLFTSVYDKGRTDGPTVVAEVTDLADEPGGQ